MRRLALILILILVSSCVSLPQRVQQTMGPASKPVSAQSTSGPALAVDASANTAAQVTQGTGLNYTVIGGAGGVVFALVLSFMAINKRLDTNVDYQRERTFRLTLLIHAYVLHPDPALLQLIADEQSIKTPFRVPFFFPRRK